MKFVQVLALEKIYISEYLVLIYLFRYSYIYLKFLNEISNRLVGHHLSPIVQNAV